MKIKTSISEFELLRCDYSRSFFDYCSNFKDTYIFDSLNKFDLISLIEIRIRIDLCEKYKGKDRWYKDVFSAFYSYLPDEIINNSKDIYLLSNKITNNE